MSSPIDYHNPQPGGQRRQRIIAMLQKSDAFDLGGVITRIVIGLPLALIAPLVLAFVLHVVCWKWDVNLPTTFLVSFLLMSLVVIPILMFFERRTAGGFYADAVRDAGNPLHADSYGEWELTRSVATANAFVEFALTGPRLLWEAIDRLRGRKTVGDAEMALAAEIVEILLDAKQGIEVRQLVAPDRTPAAVRSAIALLKHHDWGDTSSDGKRVWLRTEAANRLR